MGQRLNGVVHFQMSYLRLPHHLVHQVLSMVGTKAVVLHFWESIQVAKAVLQDTSKEIEMVNRENSTTWKANAQLAV